MDRVEVEHIEASHYRAVEEDRPYAVERSNRADQGEDLLRPIRPVDPNATGAHRLDVLGQGHDHRRDRGEAVGTVERAIVHAHDLRMGFPEGPPQR